MLVSDARNNVVKIYLDMQNLYNFLKLVCVSVFVEGARLINKMLEVFH